MYFRISSIFVDLAKRMKFYYTAIQPDGKTIEEEMDANNTAEVLEYLASKNLRPLSLKKGSSEQKKKFLEITIFEPSISIDDKIFLTKYLALMLRIGTDLFRAINILIADFDKPAVRSFLMEIRENLEKGQPFHLAFANHPKDFTPVFVNLIKSGEASGNLEKTFENLSDTLQKEQDLRQQVRSALIYPILLLTVSSFVVFFLITFVLPKISKVFSDSGFQPPFFSQIVFSIGAFVNQYFFPVIILIISTVGGLWFLFSKVDPVKKVTQRFLRKLPALGPLLNELAIQRFASTLSSLLTSGLPILDSLEITAQVVGSEEIREALIRIAREGISKGLTIGEAFRREPAFPKTITNLVAISEKSGNLSSILMTLSQFYESEIKSSIKILISFLEPALLAIVGLIVGIIALAVIVPVYQLVGKI